VGNEETEMVCKRMHVKMNGKSQTNLGRGKEHLLMWGPGRAKSSICTWNITSYISQNHQIITVWQRTGQPQAQATHIVWRSILCQVLCF